MTERSDRKKRSHEKRQKKDPEKLPGVSGRITAEIPLKVDRCQFRLYNKKIRGTLRQAVGLDLDYLVKAKQPSLGRVAVVAFFHDFQSGGKT